jgi:antibiotic biosynthesis monooxygenase (ABM) superfamily enzyme
MHITFELDLSVDTYSQQEYITHLMNDDERDKLFSRKDSKSIWIKRPKTPKIGPKYVTCCIVFHRINGAFLILNTIISLVSRTIKMPMDMMLEYSLFKNAM